MRQHKQVCWHSLDKTDILVTMVQTLDDKVTKVLDQHEERLTLQDARLVRTEHFITRLKTWGSIGSAGASLLTFLGWDHINNITK